MSRRQKPPKFRVYTYEPKKVQEWMMPQLEKLTVPYGELWYFFTNLQEKRKPRVTDRVFIARSGHELIGWATVGTRWGKKIEICMYVKNKYRRHGVGTRIISQVKKKLPKKVIWGYHHSPASRRLYNKMNIPNCY